MIRVKSLNKWANAHTYYFIDILRVALGVLLFLKGINFITQTQTLVELIKPLQGFAGTMFTVHYVAFAHLIGGLLIAVGLLTRWALLVQLPIIFGAILINFIGIMQPGRLLEASVVLVFSLFFLLYGSGKHSMDYNLKMNQ
ncbi:putative membrane protein YphA (DoxX/SURF4 family) [Salegentibacter sp. 24]|uniref:DoxX family protein n=1 Tax=Salegentibacter sp. 24 TaxID=2183986 RepID=UPI00105D570E|nr:DoxX family protein [Salegentibacter sp. 24]TDN86403.1 putative membrane protein YphA (DoxX/SURF4 family) [Salegentibacter sp. 24]